MECMGAIVMLAMIVGCSSGTREQPAKDIPPAPSAPAAVTDGNGKFSIPDLPPGKYMEYSISPER